MNQNVKQNSQKNDKIRKGIQKYIFKKSQNNRKILKVYDIPMYLNIIQNSQKCNKKCKKNAKNFTKIGS